MLGFRVSSPKVGCPGNLSRVPSHKIRDRIITFSLVDIPSPFQSVDTTIQIIRMAVLRSATNGGSLSPAPASTGPSRRRQSPDHTIFCPTLNGNILPELDEMTHGTTLGLYFGLGNAIAEQKKFESTLRRYSHQRFIDVRTGFRADTGADDLYMAKVVVNQ
ncbi:hypothetical protein F5051DRAFT_446357 [Lentinula edodes]|nr:hypothetical protein F5051DRAFT_446357 [Lentinula edodes]